MIRIKFTKLFEKFDYDLKLKNNGITIITGPNGFGKSTILRCIEALQSGLKGIIYLINLDFEKIEIFFKEERILIKKESGRFYINKTSLNIEEFKKRFFKLNYRMGSYFRYMGDENFLDRRNREEYSFDELLSNSKIFNELLDNSISLDEFASQTFIKNLNKIKEQMGNIFFIKEQRLINNSVVRSHSEAKAMNIIEELPAKLQKQIGEISEKYSKRANEYDSSYPYRLMKEKKKIDKDEFETRIKEMNKKFEKLTQYDISDINSNRKLEFKEEYATALKIFFDDFNEKYKVYEGLIDKLDLYVSIINSRLTFKKIKISRKEGIEVISDNGKKLKLSNLSSGEQQEIVLFYELIFETPNNSLLLIDEPEISLHIIWQKIFMNDLQKVVALKDLNVIVATHSPQIINNYWDNQIDLGELYGN